MERASLLRLLLACSLRSPASAAGVRQSAPEALECECDKVRCTCTKQCDCLLAQEGSFLQTLEVPVAWDDAAAESDGADGTSSCKADFRFRAVASSKLGRWARPRCTQQRAPKPLAPSQSSCRPRNQLPPCRARARGELRRASTIHSTLSWMPSPLSAATPTTLRGCELLSDCCSPK